MKTDQQKSQNIDEYIANFPPDVQVILQTIRATIHETVPEAKEAISYGMPTFKLHGNLVHFAAYKNHIGFYPTPTGIEHFAEKLAPYASGKGSAQFPVDQPIPYDLIREITLYRVEENRAKRLPKRSNRTLNVL